MSAILGLVVLVSTAHAERTWSAPVSLGTTGPDPGGGSVVVDRYATTVFWSEMGAGTRSAMRPLGSTFAAPRDVSFPVGGDGFATSPSGDVVSAWNHYDGQAHVVRVSVRPVGGEFSVPTTLSPPSGVGSIASAAINDRGDIVVAWDRFDGQHWVAQASVKRADQAFSAPVNLSAGTEDAFMPKAAIAANGDVIVAWQAFNGTHDVVEAAIAPANEPFSAPVVVSDVAMDSRDPAAAIDPAGNAAISWSSNGSNGWISLRPAGGQFTAPFSLGTPGRDSGAALLAYDGRGDLVAVWEQAIDDSWRGAPFAAIRPSGAEFSASTAIGAQGLGLDDIAVNASGDVIVAGRRDGVVQAITRPAGGSFSPPVSLSAADGDAFGGSQVAMGPTGAAAVVWGLFNGANYTVQSAVSEGETQSTVPVVSPAPSDVSPAPPPGPVAQPARKAIDLAPPVLIVRAPRSSRALTGISVHARCPLEACRLRVSGTIRIARGSGARAQTVRLRGSTRLVPAGVTVRLKVGLPARSRRDVARALDSGRAPRARVEVRAADDAGNKARQVFRVRLRR